MSPPTSTECTRHGYRKYPTILTGQRVTGWITNSPPTPSFHSTPGVSTFVTEPYYREYFADGQNYVQADNNGSPVMAHPGMAAYESRLAPIQSASDSYAAHHNNNNNNTTSVNKNTSIYAKAITGAGLTVDLPSPDSGIGADAITPRDQNNIQQVSQLPSGSSYGRRCRGLRVSIRLLDRVECLRFCNNAENWFCWLAGRKESAQQSRCGPWAVSTHQQSTTL